MYCTKHVAEDILWVGGNDRRLALFEGVYPIPGGVAYNSYLILDEHTVLIDTVDKAVAPVFLENVAHGLDGRKLDYFIIQHMEPDHAALIGEIMLRYPEAVLVCNAKTAEMIKQFFKTDVAEKAYIVSEGSVLNSGRHSLTFVNAPMVHWPEVMVTYDSTDKILFSADAFGTFGAQNGALFADEVDFDRDYLDDARRYYTNIVGKYGAQVQSVLRKASTLEIKMICPLHGFVWRQELGYILEKYLLWSSYTPEEQGVLIAYGSVYGNTENAVEIVAAGLRKNGVKTAIYDVSATHVSVLIAELFRYSHVIFAAPTYNADVYTPVKNLIEDMKAHNIQNRTVAFIENGTWKPMAAGIMRKQLEGLKNTRIIENVLSIKSAVDEEQLDEVSAFVSAVSGTVRKKAEVVDFSGVIDKSVLSSISYGLYVASANDGEKDTGCIINTPVQIASKPLRLSVSLNKANYTHDVILKTGVFNLSILSQEADMGLIRHFGFQSGRDVDKYEGCTRSAFSGNGLRYTTVGTNGYISCRVVSAIDIGSHTLFIADITETGKLGDAPSMTYEYYRKNLKPMTDAKKGYVCSVCGYVYEGETLPEDFVCPICKHGAEDFRPVE